MVYHWSRLLFDEVGMEEQNKTSSPKYGLNLRHPSDPHELQPCMTSLRKPSHSHFLLQGTNLDGLLSPKSSQLVYNSWMIPSEWGRSSTTDESDEL